MTTATAKPALVAANMREAQNYAHARGGLHAFHVVTVYDHTPGLRPSSITVVRTANRLTPGVTKWLERMQDEGVKIKYRRI